MTGTEVRQTEAGDSSARPIRVLVGEDAFLTREAIAHVLTSHSNVEVVGMCEDLYSLRSEIDEKLPDVVVTDIRMPPTGTDEGIQITRGLRKRHPEIGVVVLSQYVEPAYALAILEEGSASRAYLLKERVNDRDQLVRAIEAVAAGGSVIDPEVVDALVAARAREDASPLSELSERESEVLAEIAQGKSNAAIAESLFLTKRAVEKHINSIFLKLDLRDSEDVSRRVKATLLFLAERDD